jgi:hypothetical protein
VWLFWLVNLASAADQATAVLVLLDKRDEAGARARCTQKDAAGSDDTALREACAEAFYGLTEAQGTLAAWAAYREAWAGTTWAARALTIESDQALSDLGYASTEGDYLGVEQAYPGTDAARLAHERAVVAAVSAVTTPEDARAVAARHPEAVPDLLRTHLGAFVTARVDADGAHDVVVDPPVVDPTTVTWRWAARDEGGHVASWSDVAAALASASPVADGPKWLAGPAPAAGAWPRCAPAASVSLGVALEASGGLVFLPAPWEQGCGPDAPAVRFVYEGDQLVRIEGPWAIDLTVGAPGLTPGARGPLAAAPDLGLVVGVIGDPAAGRAAVWPTDGAPGWVTTFPPAAPQPLPTLAPTEGAAEVPRLAARLWFGPTVPPPRGGAPALAAWTGATPEGAHALSPSTLRTSAVRDLIAEIGVDAAAITLQSAWEIDLDGDATKDLVALASVGGAAHVVVASKAGRRAWVVPVPAESGSRSAAAFDLGGATYFTWTDKASVLVLRYDGRGYRVDALPLAM